MNRTLKRSEELKNKYKCKALKSIEEINAHKFDIIIIGVRLADVEELFINMKCVNLEGMLLIIMVNALKIEHIKKLVGYDIDIIRIIPNMNAINLKSTTSFAIHGENTDLLNYGISLIKKFGNIYEIKEEIFPAFVALTGTSPAFILEFFKGFEEFSLMNGFTKQESQVFLKECIMNSIENAFTSEKSLDELIDEVCVAGGPTIAGHNILKDKHFKSILIECLGTAKNKCQYRK